MTRMTTVERLGQGIVARGNGWSGEPVTTPPTFDGGADCDRCDIPADATVRCEECGNVYGRCRNHGGMKGARRSLHSHAALYHPKTGSAR